MDERNISCSYSTGVEFPRNNSPKVEGRGFKATNTWNDSVSQVRERNAIHPTRSVESAHSRKFSHRSASTVRRAGTYRNNYSCSLGHDDSKMNQTRSDNTFNGDSDRNPINYLSAKGYYSDTHAVISSTDHHSLQEADTSSVLVHAPESISGDIDNRSVSSLHLSSSITHIDHDIMIHVEYPDKETESIEQLYYTPSMSRGRAESIGGGGSVGYLSDRSTILQGNNVPAADLDYYPSTMSYKSDIATVCSGSVIEDIEILSVLSNEPSLSRLTSQTYHVEGEAKSRRHYSYTALQKYDRSVEFSLDALGNPAQRVPHQNTDSFFQPFPRLNTMGPPLNRSMLLSAVLTGDGQSSFEVTGSSRPGSVRSFASDNVFVDTDDCGGSIVESDGGRVSVADEHHSVHSHEHIHSGGDTDKCNDLDEHRREPTDLGQLHNLLLEQGINGRVSPGGTIYKGRGVRKYQGRYMNLPLKRFYQSTDSITQVDDYRSSDTSSYRLEGLQSNRDRRTVESSFNRRSERSRRSYRTRSRSRSRDRGESINGQTRNTRWRGRSQSCSPPVATDERDFEQRLSTRNADGCNWKRNKKEKKGGNKPYHMNNGMRIERNRGETDANGRGWSNTRKQR